MNFVVVLYMMAFLSDMWLVQSQRGIVFSELMNYDNRLPTLNISLLDEAMNKNRKQCGIMCFRDEQCSSFFHNRANGDCKLYSTIFVRHALLETIQGYRYNEIKHERCPLNNCFRYHRREGMCLYWKQLLVNKTYEQSETACIEKGTQLLDWTPRKSGALKDFVSNNFEINPEIKSRGNIDDIAYIGATRKNASSPWLWGNGELMATGKHPDSDWLLAQENFLEDEHCVAVSLLGDDTGWNSVDCDADKASHLMCEVVLSGDH